ncbi:MAG: hypothetical protein GX760_00265 [Erysipelothrix sp.]|nr:hypothetical protein [Erysipelothrix sp.]
MKIVSIKVTHNFVEITLDDGEKYKVSEDFYYDEKIKANLELTHEKLRQIIEAANYHAAYLKILNKLKYRDYSEYELRTYSNDNFSLTPSELDSIFEKLKRYDFINDERYVKYQIEKLQSKSYGYHWILQQLKNVRIDTILIETYLENNFDEEVARAHAISKKIVKTIKNKSELELKNSLKSKLMTRGYSSATVQAVVSDLDVVVDDDLERLNATKEATKVMRRLGRKHQGKELKMRLRQHLYAKGYKDQIIRDTIEEMEYENE